MLKKIKEYLKNYKNTMLTVNNKELRSSSKFFLSIFVVFTVMLMLQGTYYQLKKVPNGNHEVKHQCENFINKELNLNTHYYKWNIRDFEKNKRHYNQNQFGSYEKCKNIETYASKVSTNNIIIHRNKTIPLKEKYLKDLKQEKNKIEKEYGNALLEKIAEQEQSNSILSSSASNAKTKLTKITNNISMIEAEIKSLNNLEDINEFKKLQSYIRENGKDILNFKKKTEKYYVLKSVLSVYIFLIPVWLTFYFIYKYTKRREMFIFAHLAVNVANIAFLFILFFLFWLIYTIIPKTLLASIFSFFVKIGMEFIFSIFGIVFFMFLFAFIIFKLQANRKEELELNPKKRIIINRTLCPKCNNKLEQNDIHCGVCGTKVKNKCQKCNHLNYLDHDYCVKCGENISEIK